ncbi:MAG TPA: DNA polymerase IV [Gemmataceae bacterium]|nr:DNA polymerase IV [Gemmataceae bacterium]
MPDASLTILHVDMDAFYASVEQRDRPELRGQPVIVGGVGSRGVVSAASYEARPFGVHSAMPMSAARRLCPQAAFLPPRMGYYARVSQQLRDVFLSFTPLVEPLSLDEAFLDVRGCEGLFGHAPQIARQIKGRIQAETGLTASVGVAPNKFLAKLASDLGKPDGLVVVPAGGAAAFLGPLPVGRVWGVGAKAEGRLHALGVRTVGQLAALPEKALVGHFGELGRHLWRLARGEDGRAVVPDAAAKSVSTETTFARDIGDREALRSWLLGLTDHLAGRLRHAGLRARTVEVKVRSSDFRTRQRAQALGQATNATDVLWQAARRLLDRGLTDDVLPVRLLGVGASRLTREGVVQGDLFDGGRRKQEALDQTIDAIRGQFGGAAIRRGSLLDRGPDRAP